MKKIFGLTFLVVMLVGLIGCKPLTGSTVCPHDWVDTDDTKVTSAKYYEVSEGVYNFEKVEVSPKYKCSICGEEHDKTIAFFTTDDHKTTIGVATDVAKNAKGNKCLLPLNDTWTVEKYNSYYENRNTYSNKCNCGDKCVGKCVDDDCYCDKLTCIRRVYGVATDKLYFGDYYIEY